MGSNLACVVSFEYFDDRFNPLPFWPPKSCDRFWIQRIHTNTISDENQNIPFQWYFSHQTLYQKMSFRQTPQRRCHQLHPFFQTTTPRVWRGEDFIVKDWEIQRQTSAVRPILNTVLRRFFFHRWLVTKLTKHSNGPHKYYLLLMFMVWIQPPNQDCAINLPLLAGGEKSPIYSQVLCMSMSKDPTSPTRALMRFSTKTTLSLPGNWSWISMSPWTITMASFSSLSTLRLYNGHIFKPRHPSIIH